MHAWYLHDIVVVRLIDHLQENFKVKHGFLTVKEYRCPHFSRAVPRSVQHAGVVPCENALCGKLPVEEEATPEEDSASDLEQPQHKVFLMEVHREILRSKEEKLLKVCYTSQECT